MTYDGYSKFSNIHWMSTDYVDDIQNQINHILFSFYLIISSNKLEEKSLLTRLYFNIK